MAKFLLRFNCRRLSEAEMPWRFKDCAFLYVSYDGRLAFVGRAVDGQTVASFWNVHEVQSHPVTRQIIKSFGGVMGMAVYMITPSRQFPDVSVGEALLQVERTLVRQFDPPGNRPTTDRGRAAAAQEVPRSDLAIRIDGWPIGEAGYFEG